MIKLTAILLPVVFAGGCYSNVSQLDVLVNSRIQHAELLQTATGHGVSTSAPDEIVGLFNSLIPYERTGPGRIENPQYIGKFFVAGRWAEIRVATDQEPPTFSFDGYVYRSQRANGFTKIANDVLNAPLERSNAMEVVSEKPPDEPE